MGWASGSELMSQVIEAVNKAELTEEQQRVFFPLVIDAFEGRDCDTMQECLGENAVYDELLEALYREKGWWCDDDDEEWEDDNDDDDEPAQPE